MNEKERIKDLRRSYFLYLFAVASQTMPGHYNNSVSMDSTIKKYLQVGEELKRIKKEIKANA